MIDYKEELKKVNFNISMTNNRLDKAILQAKKNSLVLELLKVKLNIP